MSAGCRPPPFSPARHPKRRTASRAAHLRVSRARHQAPADARADARRACRRARRGDRSQRDLHADRTVRRDRLAAPGADLRCCAGLRFGGGRVSPGALSLGWQVAVRHRLLRSRPAVAATVGIEAPRDTDLQAASLGQALGPDEPLRRGDLVFWRGHVGIMLDAETLLHANAHHMMTAAEPLAAAEARALAKGSPVTVRRRLG